MVFIVDYILIFFVLATSKVFLYALADDDKPQLKFVFNKLEKEIEMDDFITSDISVDGRGGEIYVNGEVKQFLDLDNDWKVHIVIFRADNPGEDYSKMLALPVKGVCDAMKTYYKNYFYETLKNYANAPNPESCPVLKEEYLIKDYPVDIGKIRKFLKPGFYRISASLFSKDDEEKLKYVIHGHVEEDN